MKIRWKRILAAPLIVIAAIVILFEEWLWDDLQRLAAWIGRLPVLRQLEGVIARLPPYAALVVFAVPGLLLLPVKLLALQFIAHGHALMGVAVIITAKLVGTALVARIFTLTHASLMRIAWFARLYGWFMDFKGRVLAVVHASRIYQQAHALYAKVKAGVKALFSAQGKSFLKRRWSAARELTRRWRQNNS